jgi:hypothetical protein
MGFMSMTALPNVAKGRYGSQHERLLYNYTTQRNILQQNPVAAKDPER